MPQFPEKIFSALRASVWIHHCLGGKIMQDIEVLSTENVILVSTITEEPKRSNIVYCSKRKLTEFTLQAYTQSSFKLLTCS